MPVELNNMLRKCEEDAKKFAQSSGHPIDFFNEEKLQWRNKMTTTDDELGRPLGKGKVCGVCGAANFLFK